MDVQGNTLGSVRPYACVAGGFARQKCNPGGIGDIIRKPAIQYEVRGYSSELKHVASFVPEMAFP